MKSDKPSSIDKRSHWSLRARRARRPFNPKGGIGFEAGLNQGAKPVKIVQQTYSDVTIRDQIHKVGKHLLST